jgi:carboxymethylproline synthase
LGIACTYGGYMLEKCVGRSIMLDMLMSCDPWPAERALHDHLLHEVVPVDDLLEAALARARRCAAYAPAGFRGTKPFLNADYIEGLERVRVIGKAAHRAAFAAGAAQQNMRRVLGDPVPAVEQAG